jgi:rod shape determining protein RodA
VSERSPFDAPPRTSGSRGGGRGAALARVRWLELDWHVLAVALGLLVLGLFFVRAMANAESGLEGGGINFRTHLVKVGVTLPLLGVGLLVRPRFLRRNAWAIYGACILLLALLPFVGVVRNNARSWIELPFFDLQPSELAKLGLIVALARALHRNRLARVAQWLLPLALAGLPMMLVAMQPDLGTAITIAPVTLGMLYLAGARARVLGACVAGVLVAGSLAVRYELGVHDYQLQRIDTWLEAFDPETLIEGKNGPAFHSYHAHTAIGNGGVFGTGLGRGVANRTGYLPERESDSIFAVVAEEAGYIGAACILFLYALLVVLLMGSASGIRDRFPRLVVGGIAIYLGAHLFINVGVNVGLLPMTGLTLPLFSTGGSSLLVTFLALGIALGLSAHHEASLDRDAFRA